VGLILPTPERFDASADTLIIGAGAAGLIAALAHGPGALVIEAESMPSGSTALSAGLIPAAGTRFQSARGIEDSTSVFMADIQAKANNQNDPDLVQAMAGRSARVVEWLADQGLPFSLVDDFDYPGHSRRRMHGLPTRSGRELVDHLRRAVEDRGIDILCNRRADALFASSDHVTGARLRHGDNPPETIGASRTILACNGFGGNKKMVATHLPDIQDAVWFGHDGNRGEAVVWGQALGAGLRNLGAYQGHGNVAHPHGILITWAVIMEGGIQVNTNGARFWNETKGYSEAARVVLAQPSGIAWTIFDEPIAQIARQFEDFRAAEAQQAIRTASTVAELAFVTGLPEAALQQSLSAADMPVDPFGRDFGGRTLSPPYRAVQVTGALFHTQGGLVVDPATALVRRDDGRPFPTLYAAGGAACGVSGQNDDGYLSGNGLLSAVTLGWVAGRHAAGEGDAA
jgi:fumarate reductase flavoprotein subunit